MSYTVPYKIGIKLREGAKMPERAHDDDTGIDRFAYLPGGCVTLEPFIPQRIPLGFYLDLPPRLGVQIRPRSSLSLAGVHVSLGTVDCGYRGELMATTWSSRQVIIAHGQKICQLVLEFVVHWGIVPVAELSETKRGEGGYGSSGQ